MSTGGGGGGGAPKFPDKAFLKVPSDGGKRSSVPRGSFAVYVGEEMRRFVIPEEEFGFCHQGTLRIPCDVDFFQAILRLVQQLQGRKKEEPVAAMCDCSCSCSSETEILYR